MPCAGLARRAEVRKVNWMCAETKEEIAKWNCVKSTICPWNLHAVPFHFFWFVRSTETIQFLVFNANNTVTRMNKIHINLSRDEYFSKSLYRILCVLFDFGDKTRFVLISFLSFRTWLVLYCVAFNVDGGWCQRTPEERRGKNKIVLYLGCERTFKLDAVKDLFATILCLWGSTWTRHTHTHHHQHPAATTKTKKIY